MNRKNEVSALLSKARAADQQQGANRKSRDRRVYYKRAGTPLSMPVSWEALARATDGNQFTIENWKRHLKAEPWAEIGKVRQRLPD